MRGNETPAVSWSVSRLTAFSIPMRGNELAGQVGVRRGRDAGFSIPMRGNERQPSLRGVARAISFSIPMRGNEADVLPFSADNPQEFSIPMRGNEVMTEIAEGGQTRTVFDPHEG